MRSILDLFGPRRPPRRPRKSGNGDWADIGLSSLGGSIASGRAKPKRSAAPTPAAPRDDIAHGYLAAHGLEKSYGRRKVVNGVTLYMRRGEAVGLLGPNGAGKTTAFYTITGLIKPERGTIELDGYDSPTSPCISAHGSGSATCPRRHRSFAASTWRTTFALCWKSSSPISTSARPAGRAARRIQNTSRRKNPIDRAPGGERRRVEIARALATRPKLHAARRARSRASIPGGRAKSSGWYSG